MFLFKMRGMDNLNSTGRPLNVHDRKFFRTNRCIHRILGGAILFGLLAVMGFVGGCTPCQDAVRNIGHQEIECRDFKAAAVSKDGWLILTCMGQIHRDDKPAKLCYLRFCSGDIEGRLRENEDSMSFCKGEEKRYFFCDDGKPWVKLSLNESGPGNDIPLTWAPPPELAGATSVELVPITKAEKRKSLSQSCAFRVLYRWGKRECWVLIPMHMSKEQYEPGGEIVRALLWVPAMVADVVCGPINYMAFAIGAEAERKKGHHLE